MAKSMQGLVVAKWLPLFGVASGYAAVFRPLAEMFADESFGVTVNQAIPMLFLSHAVLICHAA